jgi:hypothetical protein
MQDTVLNLFNSTGMAWWVEVVTENPSCTYYFGPFMKESNAQAALPGYVDDLVQEGAIGIRAIAKRCKPEQLTIINDESSEPELGRVIN